MTTPAMSPEARPPRVIGAEDFDPLLLGATPLLDLRAPVEFANGTIPGAVNLPLLDDDEREQVGIRYRQAGQDAAIRLGHELVAGAVRAARLDAWVAWARQHPDGVLYCFRGGQRSQIVQGWLAEAGLDVPRVAGGYKALRRHLLGRIDHLAQRLDPLMLGGRTGTGKTRLLERLPRHLDLEGLAGHRGSAFGTRVGGQPTPIDFENRLALALMHLDARAHAPVVIEDEGRNVGRLSVPPTLFARMSSAPLVVVETGLEERVRVTLEEYVLDNLAEHERALGSDAFEAFSEYLLGALGKIRKRLGGARHALIEADMRAALTAHRRSGDTSAHEGWIRRLLSEYYDPMYDHQLAGKAERIAFRGDPEAVVDWLARRTQRPASA